MADRPIKQIFILGRHRSGTTWLANCLATVDGVFTPQLDLHHGQVESAFFSSVAPYFNEGETHSDRIALSVSFSNSDYFSALGIPAASIIQDAPPHVLFRDVMSKAARKNMCDVWIEKTPGHSLLIDSIATKFPNAYYIRVKRQLTDQAVSCAIGLMGGISIRNLLAAAFATGVFDKILNGANVTMIEVKYEDLKQNYTAELDRILNSLGLENRRFSTPAYQPNSSYSPAYSNEKKRASLNVLQRAVVRAGWLTALAIPRIILVKTLYYWRKVKTKSLPTWMFAKKNTQKT